MMSDVRFILCQDDFGNYEIRDNNKVFHFLWEVAPILNEQQATINNQEQKIKILQQEINDTQAILEMQSEKLKGWNDE